MKKRRMPLLILIVILLSLSGLPQLLGQTAAQTKKEGNKTEKTEKEKRKKKSGKTQEPGLKKLLYEVNVTATRVQKDKFDTPKPVSVIDKKKLVETAPNNVSEMLQEMPGVDSTGVGANQTRPVIRGLRGQRILLLEDGIRMNNSRRQQDFGEIPSLVDVSEVAKVEVVRGPASVLYGSDAIGGVVNIITQSPAFSQKGSHFGGNLSYRFGSAENQHKGAANLFGNLGPLNFRVSGSYRQGNEYKAPAGTFGQITLDEKTVVNDTGLIDNGFNLMLGYSFRDNNRLFFKYESYRGRDAGFGYVDPALYDEGSPTIQILYPNQKVDKYSLRYENRSLNSLVADALSLTAYQLSNRRDLNMNIHIPFSFMPGTGIQINSVNYTDVGTLGFRLEMTKVLFKNHIFTYGADFFRDNSANTDTTTTTMIGFGPPRSSIDTTPQVPNARYRSYGFFVQDDIPLFSKTSMILGVRYQNVNALTQATPGLEDQPLADSTDQTVVASANLIQGLTDQLKLVLSVGRGFRSPNLIERFFNGQTPEGSGFQSRNLNLKAETSLNLDFGLKYRSNNVYLEGTYFTNTIFDGIRIIPTGGTVNELTEYQNVNIDKLRFQGFELLGQFFWDFGLSLSANFTYMSSKDLVNSDIPYVDTYGSKLNGQVRYTCPRSGFWIEYHMRHHGNQKDLPIVDNPIGLYIPGFTVHNLRTGITLFKNSSFPQQLSIVFANISNTLYSEFSNATFFRPAPARRLVFSWSTGF